MTDALKPWYSIATPHSDIREGKLEEAVYAANIWAVVQKTAPEVYRDPKEFMIRWAREYPPDTSLTFRLHLPADQRRFEPERTVQTAVQHYFCKYL